MKNSRLSAYPGRAAKRAESEVVRTAALVKPGVALGPSMCTVIDPSSDSVNAPGTVNEIPIATLKNVTSTFADSLLILLMKSLTSCSDRGFMEFTFIRMVREYGFVRAQEVARATGIPHYRSAELLNAVLWGERQESGD